MLRLEQRPAIGARKLRPGDWPTVIATVDGHEVGRLQLDRQHFGKRYAVAMAPGSADPRLALAAFVLARALSHPRPNHRGGGSGGDAG